MALPHRDLAAQEPGWKLAGALRSAHRRTAPGTGRRPRALGALRRGALPDPAAARRVVGSPDTRYRHADDPARPAGARRRDPRRGTRTDPHARRSDRHRARFFSRRSRPLRVLFLVTALFASAASGQSTLDSVRSKGFVQCGVNTGLAGFSQPDSKGVWRGVD